MKALPFAPGKLLQNSKFYLFGIAVGLSVLHLVLTWRLSSDIDLLIVGAIFWGAILWLLWRKQDKINLESDIFSSFFGILLIVLVLVKSISLFWVESSFLRIIPIIATLGIGLLASGIKGLKQYWRELIIVLLLSLPESSFLQVIEDIFNATTLTANFAVLLLWYLGFEVSRQGADIILPNGSVSVAPFCTGVSNALLLLKLSVLFILMFPTDWLKKILVLIGSVVIAFVTSGIRVALMAVVVSNQEAFRYWHGPPGNQIFATLSILIYGLFCRFLLRPAKLASPDLELQ
jgi:cyanoexosortase A